MTTGRLRTDHLVTHHFDLDETQAAFDAQQRDRTAVTVMIHRTKDRT